MVRFIIAVLFLAGPAWAFPDAGIAEIPSAPTSAQVVPSAAPSVPASLLDAIGNPDAPMPDDAVVVAAKEAAGAVQDAMARPTLVTVVFGVAAVLWAVIALLRTYGPRWVSPRVIRLATLVAAPVLTFATAWASGQSWFDALILAGSGPGALLLNELRRGVTPAAGA